MQNPNSIKEAIEIIKLLLVNKDLYFSGDYLNSDGRKYFEKALKHLIREYPWLRRRIYRVRRDPNYYEIEEFLLDLLELVSE